MVLDGRDRDGPFAAKPVIRRPDKRASGLGLWTRRGNPHPHADLLACGALVLQSRRPAPTGFSANGPPALRSVPDYRAEARVGRARRARKLVRRSVELRATAQAENRESQARVPRRS